MFITAFAIIALATCPTFEKARPSGTLQKPSPGASGSPPQPLRPRRFPARRNPNAKHHRDALGGTDRDDRYLERSDVYGHDVYGTDLYGSDLYSRRARRRMETFLRLRILEMRKAGLDRAADVVEHRLCPDALLGP